MSMFDFNEPEPIKPTATIAKDIIPPAPIIEKMKTVTVLGKTYEVSIE